MSSKVPVSREVTKMVFGLIGVQETALTDSNGYPIMENGQPVTIGANQARAIAEQGRAIIENHIWLDGLLIGADVIEEIIWEGVKHASKEPPTMMGVQLIDSGDFAEVLDYVSKSFADWVITQLASEEDRENGLEMMSILQNMMQDLFGFGDLGGDGQGEESEDSEEQSDEFEPDIFAKADGGSEFGTHTDVKERFTLWTPQLIQSFLDTLDAGVALYDELLNNFETSLIPMVGTESGSSTPQTGGELDERSAWDSGEALEGDEAAILDLLTSGAEGLVENVQSEAYKTDDEIDTSNPVRICVMAIDISGSMSYGQRLARAALALAKGLQQVEEGKIHLGVIIFDGDAYRFLMNPDDPASCIITPENVAQAKLILVHKLLRTSGGATNIPSGVLLAVELLEEMSDANYTSKEVLIITDNNGIHGTESKMILSAHPDIIVHALMAAKEETVIQFCESTGGSALSIDEIPLTGVLVKADPYA